MIPYILAAVGGYLIGDSLKGKQFAKGGNIETIRRFNRHEQMDSQTRDEILDTINALRDFQIISNERKYNLLENALYGLYDGYDYSQTGMFNEKIEELKKDNINLSERIKKIYEKIGNYNFNTMADGGMVDQNQRIRFRIAYVIGVDKALKYLDKDYVVSPFHLIEAAVRKGFITIEEIDENLWNEAVSEAEDIEESYRDSGQGIGSSDMNAFISRMLNSAGIKIGVIDNKYQRI
jgi:hypothetical protein